MNNLIPNWPVPENIGVITTLRTGGVSKKPYASNNMALHVGDKNDSVKVNRKALVDKLNLPSEPVWLEQTHSARCVVVEKETERQADAAITSDPAFPLAILTADCLPILFCDRRGKEIAAIHAGWKGLAQGIIENTLHKMDCQPSALMAWIGPGICSSCYEVDEEVMSAFATAYPGMREGFKKQDGGWYADLSLLAQMILAENGLHEVYQSSACTLEEKNNFYSYRRDGQTGRMATLIWFKKDKNYEK